MNKIKDVEEFEICCDISSRMALFALVMSCDSNKEIENSFDAIALTLADCYPKDKLDSLVESYKHAAILAKNEGL